MKKLGAKIYLNGELISVSNIQEYNSASEFCIEQKEAEKNLSRLFANYLLRIQELEKRIFDLEVEMKYNRGEITEKELKELCGTK